MALGLDGRYEPGDSPGRQSLFLDVLFSSRARENFDSLISNPFASAQESRPVREVLRKIQLYDVPYFRTRAFTRDGSAPCFLFARRYGDHWALCRSERNSTGEHIAFATSNYNLYDALALCARFEKDALLAGFTASPEKFYKTHYGEILAASGFTTDNNGMPLPVIDGIDLRKGGWIYDDASLKVREIPDLFAPSSPLNKILADAAAAARIRKTAAVPSAPKRQEEKTDGQILAAWYAKTAEMKSARETPARPDLSAAFNASSRGAPVFAKESRLPRWSGSGYGGTMDPD